MIQDAVTPLVISFIVNDSSCERRGVPGGCQAISLESFLFSSRTTAAPTSPQAFKKQNKTKKINPLVLSSLPISSSVVHLGTDGKDPALRVEFRYIYKILHGYCVIVRMVVVPPEASSSSPGGWAFGRFWELRAL